MDMIGKRWMGVALLVVSGACGGGSGTPDAGTPVDRGRYIVNNVGVCTFCHTPLLPDGTRDQTKFLSGVDCLFDLDPTPGAGCISSRNLTNHATGLMAATSDQIKNAFRNGMRTDAKNMVPIMPYYIFHNMTDVDADAVVAYLRTVPGVNHVVSANEPPWDAYFNGFAPVAVPVDPLTIPMPVASYPNQDAALRGRYLAGYIGLCIDCHTPHDLSPTAPRPIKIDMAFIGGEAFTKEQLGLVDPLNTFPPMIYTANLTPDATGLQDWTVDDIVKVLKQGLDRQGHKVCAAAHGDNNSPYSGLTDGDASDIANYVLSLPAVVNMRTADCVGP